MNGDAHIFVVLRTEEFCDDHTGAHGHTVEETHKHVDQTAGGTDGRQRRIADEFTDGPGVEGVVALLENVAQKNGHSKQKNLFPDRTFCQSIAVRMQDDHFL